MQCPRAGCQQSDAGLLGQATPGVGHVHGSRFVTGVHEPDVPPDSGIENGHNLVAGKGEEVPYACLDQGFDEQVRSRVRHG